MAETKLNKQGRVRYCMIDAMDGNALAEALKQKARELGFSFVGIVPAQPSRRLAAFQAWISAELHGKMGYLARPDRQVRRADLNIILPNVQSIICVGLDYHTMRLPAPIANDPNRGRISNYAWGVDYHDVMTPRLTELARWLAVTIGEEVSSKAYVDTGAILERSHAEDAGLGFVGKNTMLIQPRSGSYFFLGELLTTKSLPFDAPPRSLPDCGSCTQCLSDCPTDAFPSPYVLDARRCISYLTIELKEWIPHELRPLMDNWIYGCDVCQTVCPWNRFAQPTLYAGFHAASIDVAAPHLSEMLDLTNEQFIQRYANSPIKRIKRNRFVRNICIATGNSGNAEFVPKLIKLLGDEDRVVRGTAAWAIGRIHAAGADAIAASLAVEPDEDVRHEMQLALATWQAET